MQWNGWDGGTVTVFTYTDAVMDGKSLVGLRVATVSTETDAPDKSVFILLTTEQLIQIAMYAAIGDKLSGQ